MFMTQEEKVEQPKTSIASSIYSNKIYRFLICLIKRRREGGGGGDLLK